MLSRKPLNLHFHSFHIAILKLSEDVKSLPEILLKKKCANVLIITDKASAVWDWQNAWKKLWKKIIFLFHLWQNGCQSNYCQCKRSRKPSGTSPDAKRSSVWRRFQYGLCQAVAARIAKPHQSLAQMKGILKIHKKLPLLIAIPTTAGTGSETTLAAVITDAETRYKYAINDFPLIPRYAVLDPKLL